MPMMTRPCPPRVGPRAGLYDGTRHRTRGFTLTELLIVLGLVALLVSLLMPVVGRMRSTAQAVGCVANLKQMCTAWTMCLSENGGRLTEYVWNTPDRPDAAWNGYWTGAMDRAQVRGNSLLCPAAPEPTPSDASLGYGTALHAWTGRFEDNGTAVRFKADTYRQSSYGFNRYLTATGGFGANGGGTLLSEVGNAWNVPVYFDCIYADAWPQHGSASQPVEAPPHLRGDGLTRLPRNRDHWKFLIVRHGRGVNVAFADGSARWVPLEEAYTLNWKEQWTPYRLALPVR
jgi:prepilin-type N-terminal cleavage/methylation domain-containing protein/prepilin-type processing-associated H-X9-DG protein